MCSFENQTRLKVCLFVLATKAVVLCLRRFVAAQLLCVTWDMCRAVKAGWWAAAASSSAHYVPGAEM